MVVEARHFMVYNRAPSPHLFGKPAKRNLDSLLEFMSVEPDYEVYQVICYHEE